jgi:hypothetical protein
LEMKINNLLSRYSDNENTNAWYLFNLPTNFVA